MDTITLVKLYILFVSNILGAYIASHVGVLTGNYNLIITAVIYLQLFVVICVMTNSVLANRI